MTTQNNLLDGIKPNIDSGYKSGEYDKEAWKMKKAEIREKTYRLLDDSTNRIANEPDYFKRYLDVQSKFIHYSIGNAILINAQKPQATAIKDFDSWKEHGAYVNAGEMGFLIIEPGKEYTKDDGSKGVYYESKKVFDISQTNAKAPAPKKPLNERSVIKALINKCPSQIITQDEDLIDGKAAHFDPSAGVIHTQTGWDANCLFQDLAKEISHSYMANSNQDYIKEPNELYATSTAYMLCKLYDVQVDERYDLSDSKHIFRNLAPKDIRAEISKITDNVSVIKKNMDKSLEQEAEKSKNNHER